LGNGGILLAASVINSNIGSKPCQIHFWPISNSQYGDKVKAELSGDDIGLNVVEIISESEATA